MAKDRLTINAKTLMWARERSGYDLETAAKRLGINTERLRKIESGSLSPTAVQTREAARVYQVSPAAFFLSKTPEIGFVAPVDFRSISADQGQKTFPPVMRQEIERVRAQQRLLTELDRYNGSESPNPRLPSIAKLASEEAGSVIRAWLEPVRSDWEAGGNDGSVVNLQDYIAAVERNGVFVAQLSKTPLADMRGACLRHPNYPMIVLNGKDLPAPRLFTLMHELAHLLSNEESVCNDPFAVAGTEAYCNAVAAAILMPRLVMLDHPRMIAIESGHRWTIDELGAIARDFAVSKEAVFRRLVTLGKASPAEYQRFRKDLQQEYSGFSGESTGGPARDVMLLRNLGSRYVTRVVDARRRGLLTDSEVGDFIFAKVHWAEAMADRLGIPYDG